MDRSKLEHTYIKRSKHLSNHYSARLHDNFGDGDNIMHTNVFSLDETYDERSMQY